MEPLLLVCGGCGVKIRAADPERARNRDCPRCATPLASAVAEAFRFSGSVIVTQSPAISDSISRETEQLGNQFAAATRTAKWWSRLAIIAAGLLVASSVIHLTLAPRVTSTAAFLLPGVKRPVLTADPTPNSPLSRPIRDELSTDVLTRMVKATEIVGKSSTSDLSPVSPPPVVVLSDLGVLEGEISGATTTPPALKTQVPADQRDPVPPTNPPPHSASTPGQAEVAGGDELEHGPPPPSVAPSTVPEPRRLLVQDENGKAVVAREHGMHKDRMAVLLPDGTIGWPTSQVFTDEPFVPATIDDLERTLLKGEYASFRTIKTKHYLIFYQSSKPFAQDSADLLERLYDKLTGALKKNQLPVTPVEFPLIAVIFRTEDDFRTSRKLPSEVQAIYEILSNRIFFFEKSKRESSSPEVAALRKPQTVAHEGTHQLLHNVGIQRRMSPWPIWLVEGFAEYCSPPTATKRGTDWAGLGQINPMHLTTIRDLDDPMSSVVRGGPKALSERDRGHSLAEYLVTREDLTPTDYALSWGLTHYLARERLDQFVAYIRKLNRLLPFESRSPAEQLADFREIFGKDLVKLDAQVAKHLAKIKIPDSQALPYYAVLMQQPISRTAVRRMAMVSQSPSVIRQWVETASNASGGQVEFEYYPFPTRTRAMLAADTWTHQGR